jgi:hypothetical protein
MHRRASVIVMAIAGSILIYIAAGLYIADSQLSRGLTEERLYGFYFAAVFLAFGSIAWRRTQMRRLRLEVVTGLRGLDGLLRHFFQTTIIAAALAEIIGLLALVVAIMGGDKGAVVRLGVVALVVELFTYPRRRAWQQAIDYFAATTPGPEQ